MSEHEFGSDPWLDAKLRNVPIPVGLVAKLSQISSAEDAQLDAAIADVRIPDGLLERLLAIPSESRRVALYRAEKRRRMHLPELAVAASMLLAAGLFYLGSLWGEHNTLSNLAERSGSAAASPDVLADDADHPSNLETHDGALKPDTDQFVEHAPVRADVIQPEVGMESDDSLPIVPPGDFAPIRSAASGPVFGKDPTHDVLPELQSIGPKTSLGVVPPRVNGYDLLFQLRHGDHPFASPSADKQLASLGVPLETSTKSYEAWKRAVRSGELPTGDTIRTEHFLAAVNYNFPPPDQGALALRTAAGPAPADSTGLRLLQVGVQAAVQPTDHAPAHLTIAIDTSATMAHGGGLDAAKEAVISASRYLGPDDRISIVTLSDRAELLMSEVRIDDVRQIDAAFDHLPSGRATNFVAGVDQAVAIARRALSGPVHKLVLITDGLAETSDELTQHITSALTEANVAGVQTVIIATGGEFDEESQLSELARIAKCRHVRGSTAADVRFALLEALTGRSPVVARKASLKLVFNPQAVDRYRLVGHEAKTLTGPDYAPLEVDLRSGEAATALVELWLKPTGGDDVATADLTWQDAITGAAGQQRQRISRLQFGKSFVETPVSLQSASLAAQTAEVLRGSYYAASNRTLRQVLQLAGSMNVEAQSETSLRELLDLARSTLRLQRRLGATASSASSSEKSTLETSAPERNTDSPQ